MTNGHNLPAGQGRFYCRTFAPDLAHVERCVACGQSLAGICTATKPVPIVGTWTMPPVSPGFATWAGVEDGATGVGGWSHLAPPHWDRP